MRFFRSRKCINTTFDQYQRLTFKNRMFSLPNDLLSKFSVLFTNSSLAAHDSIDNRVHRHKTEQSQNSHGVIIHQLFHFSKTKNSNLIHLQAIPRKPCYVILHGSENGELQTYHLLQQPTLFNCPNFN